MRKVILAAAALVALASAAAFAEMHTGHDHPDAAAAPKGDGGKSSLAYQAANLKMHDAMDVTYTGNADVDFVTGMIPHHQGAVNMAKVVLTYGKDPELRKLAQEIVKAQESEIAMMRGWLKQNAK